MTVETIHDCTDIIPNMYEGSVLKEVRETMTLYTGVFCSSFGSYFVSVPKNRCVIKKDIDDKG